MLSKSKKYEIRTLHAMNWQVEARGCDRGSALASANGLAANSSIEGVIVVEDIFDISKGRYQERTIFSFSRQDDENFCNFSAHESNRRQVRPRPLTPGSVTDTEHLAEFAQSAAF